MGKIRRRTRCPKCSSLNVIKWSVREGHQRYRCKDCKVVFTPRRPDVSSSNRFVWFRKWVLGKRTLEALSEESGNSERQLRRWFSEYLESVPEWTVPRRKGVHLLIDGTWLPDGRCVVVYRDQDRKSTLYYRFCNDENEYEISADLIMLREIGVSITSFTTDGSDDIIRAIKYTHPHTLRQRCLVHVERKCLLLLTQHPRTSAGITLRRLVRLVNRIRTHNDRIFWLRELDRWHDEYGEFIRQKSVNAETGEMSYTHDKVRKAYVHLKRAIPNMFKFLDRPDVPKNTNAIESFFGHLKDNLRIHRGLSYGHKTNFIKWYFFFTNEKKKTPRIE